MLEWSDCLRTPRGHLTGISDGVGSTLEDFYLEALERADGAMVLLEFLID